MWKCLKCGRLNPDIDTKCQCGADVTMNYLKYRTLTPLVGQEKYIKKPEEKAETKSVVKPEPVVKPTPVVEPTPVVKPIPVVTAKKVQKGRRKVVLALGICAAIGAAVNARNNSTMLDYSSSGSTMIESSVGGEAFRSTFAHGEYLAGTIIPVGDYTCTLGEDSYYATIQVIDTEMGEERYIELDYEINPSVQLSLEYGKIVKVSYGEIVFESPNAQADARTATLNSSQDTVTVWNGAVAGRDFPAGVYGVNWMTPQAGEGIEVRITDVNGYMLNWCWLDEFTPDYSNFVIPEGAQITMDVEELLLIPSLIINSGDYTGYYNYIY